MFVYLLNFLIFFLVSCTSSNFYGPRCYHYHILLYRTPTFVTAVERGLTELRKLGIEQQLWEGSRADIDEASPALENQ